MSTNTNRMQFCDVCSKSATLKCGRCGITWYCSQDCQKLQWKEHKKGCGKVGKVVPQNAAELHRIIIQNDDLEAYKESLHGNNKLIFVDNQEDVDNQFSSTCVYGAPKIAQYLIDKYVVDLNHLVDGSYTYLMLVCIQLDIDMAILLISCGVDTTTTNNDGITAFDMIGTSQNFAKSEVKAFKLKCQEALLKYNGSIEKE